MKFSRHELARWTRAFGILTLCGTLLGSTVGLAQNTTGSQPVAGPSPTDGEDPPPQDLSDEGESLGSRSTVAPGDKAARSKWLTQRLDAAAAKAQKIAGATVSAIVIDLATGSPSSPVWALAPDTGLNLASNTKLLTAGAALSALGPGFRWRTQILAEDFDIATGVVKGDLFVKGKGDPTLTYRHLEQLAKDLHAAGVRKVTGKLVLDVSYFDNANLPPHFDEKPADIAAYRAEVSAFGVERNAVTLVVEPAIGSDKPVVRLDPPVTTAIVVKTATVESVSEGSTRIKVVRKVAKHKTELTVTGKARAGAGFDYSRFRVEDSLRFGHDAMRAALRSAGIKVPATYATGNTPAKAKLLASHDSETLGNVVRDMNKSSDNYLAEAILKTLGAQTSGAKGKATWADGTAAVRQWVTGTAKVPGIWRADNGSGLFGGSEMSARQLGQVLVAARQDDRIGVDFVASLPIAGLDGTLARRFSASAAKGLVRAKTGTLDNVSTLAGYAGTVRAPFAFVILVNGFAKKDKSAVRDMQDEIAEIVTAYAVAGGSK